MEDTELVHKAIKACHDYHKLYGVFPGKVEIQWERCKTFPYHSIKLPELDEPPSVNWTEIQEVPQLPSIKIHTAQIEAVVGPDISRDEIYLPAHDDETKIISSKELSRLLAARDASLQGRG